MARHVSILIVAALALAGCVPNVTELAQALSQSDRSWCLSASSIYATVRIGGTGALNSVVTCTQEGLSVQSLGPK